MKYTLLLLATTAIVAGCAKLEPLCDREAQDWDKFETVEDECAVVPAISFKAALPTDSDKPTDPVDPKDPVDPTDPDDRDEHNDYDKVKDDNSDANGKGGNKHDRFDKNKYSQEIAEDKKD